METEGVSIIIAVCNVVGVTRLCIDYIKKNTVTPYELVIVDNGSTDSTREYVGQLSKELDVHYLRNETNLGPIKAINQGIRASKYEYICSMHNDAIIFEKEWLKKITSIMNRDPRIGIAALAGWQHIRKNSSCDEETLKHNLLTGGLAEPMKKEVEDIAVADDMCFVFTKRLIEDTGLLDEAYGMMYFYDTDFSMASLKAGYRNVAVNVLGFHIGNGGTTRRSDSYKRLVPDARKLCNRNSKIFKKKWKDMLPYDVRTVNIQERKDHENTHHESKLSV